MTIIDIIHSGECSLPQFIELYQNMGKVIQAFAIRHDLGMTKIDLPDIPGTDIKLVGSCRTVVVARVEAIEAMKKGIEQANKKGKIIH